MHHEIDENKISMLSSSISREQSLEPHTYEVDRERKLSLQRVSKQNLLHHQPGLN